MKKRFLHATVYGLIFGIITGIAGVCIVHYYEGNFGEDAYFDIFGWLSVPGVIISWIQNGSYDWCVDEGWDYRYSSVIWNTLFWSIMFAMGYTILHLINEVKNKFVNQNGK